MADKMKKVPFRLQKELIIVVAVLIVMVVATLLLGLPTKSEKFISKWQNAGSSIASNELFEEVSADKLSSIIEKEDKVFVLFVTPLEGDNQKLFDEVISQASTYKVEKVYILDSTDYQGNREDDSELNTKLHDLEVKFSVDLDNIPTLWVSINGTVTQMSNKVYEKNSSYTQAVKDILVLNLPVKE